MRAFLVALACAALPAFAATDFGRVTKVGTGETAIDTRPLAQCRAASLPGARCLPPSEFIGERGQLPSERDLLWLLGTVGLDGSERVVVAGDTASAREFVAGLLYLAGQKDVRVLDAPLTPLLKVRGDAALGQERSLIRSTVFTAPMRDALWIVDRREAGADAIVARDAYTAIRRFARRLLDTGEAVRVGWALAEERR
ncbi:rhodanese-like domain-containing protein [Sulfuricystis multivorans]|uniref:rhodanese-like domain-containing protein n=1 Tax=Sulfuricystis multivorans TaxID=2211108 RepID=UPI000F836877|nr:rhodanese-like domain-containing protein [Sulfuricystis multivorans]